METKTLYTTKKGQLTIGEDTINVAMLNNGSRVICKPAFKEGLVDSKSIVIDRDTAKVMAQLPLYLELFLDHLPELKAYQAGQIDHVGHFKFTDGERQELGYDVSMLATATETYLRYRDALKLANKPIPEQYTLAIKFSGILMTKLAYVGMTALVDEAIGYQEVRSKTDLPDMLMRETN